MVGHLFLAKMTSNGSNQSKYGYPGRTKFAHQWHFEKKNAFTNSAHLLKLPLCCWRARKQTSGSIVFTWESFRKSKFESRNLELSMIFSNIWFWHQLKDWQVNDVHKHSKRNLGEAGLIQHQNTPVSRNWSRKSMIESFNRLEMPRNIRENPMTLNKPNCNRKLASSLHKGQAQFKSWCMVWMKEAWRWCQESSRNIRNQLNGCSNLSKTKKRHGETRMSERVRERVCDSDSYRRCERATGKTMSQNLRNSHFLGELCWGPDVYRKTFFDWLQKYYGWRHDDS